VSKPKILLWYEKHIVGFNYTWTQRFSSYFGVEARFIDTLKFFKREPGRTPVVYYSMEEAIADLHDHHWVFLDPRGDVILDEFKHPSGPVVYAFGSDSTGFGKPVKKFFDNSFEGEIVRLRKKDEIYVLHALPYVLYDRQIFLDGRRKI
jgi:hypothetical protein